MLLNLTDLSSEPLHQQMFRQLRALVLSGECAAGESLPSIRGMAKQQRVSVITVQRAYDDLERAGLIVSRRGKGFYVVELDNQEKLRMAQSKANETLTRAVQEASAEGLAPQQIRDLLEQILQEEGNQE